MLSRLKRLPVAAASIAVVLTASGCQDPGPQPLGNSAATEKAASPAASVNESLRGAAEPFEALTEQAFTAGWPAVDKLIGDARTALAESARASGKADPLEPQLAAIAAARSDRDRVGLALASVEAYRELIEAQDRATADPPIPVSLLDYAGFRYDALAQAPNVDWAEMARSVEFARSQWDAIRATIHSKAMPGVMSESLAAMAGAVERRDVAAARSAAATELALVDLLEEQAAAKR